MTSNTTNNANNSIGIFKSLVNFFINPDGSISTSKILVGFLIFMCSALYVDRDRVMKAVESFNYGRSYEAYIEAEHKIHKADFEAAIRLQTQSVYSIVAPALVSVYMYEPEDLHHFKKLVHFEGKMLDNAVENKMKMIGVDKSDKEYKDHILGIPYFGDIHNRDKEDSEQHPVKYTCPIFNYKGVYTGVFGIYWNSKPKDIDSVEMKQKLYVACTQAARQIGIHKM